MAEKFAAHYAMFMPGLKQILSSTPSETKAQKDLRANCIQTIGNILDSVKDQPEICVADANEISQSLISLLNSNTLDEADPQILAIQNMVSQLAACLKADFKPFLPPLMESLFRDARRDLDFKIVDAVEADLEEQEDGEKNDLQKIVMKIKGMEGQKTIQMNTTALENKLNAVQIIRSLAQEMKYHFADYVDPVTQLIVSELMHDKLSSTVRKEATKTCAALIGCLREQADQQRVLKVVLPQICMEIATKLERTDFRSCKWLTKEVQRCLHGFENFKGQLLDQ